MSSTTAISDRLPTTDGFSRSPDATSITNITTIPHSEDEATPYPSCRAGVDESTPTLHEVPLEKDTPLHGTSPVDTGSPRAESSSPSPSPRPRRVSRRSPDHIPRPPNSFMLFRSEMCQSGTISLDIEHDHRRLSQIIGHYWNQLTDEEKKPWRTKAIQAKIAHKKMYPDYRYSPGERTKPTKKRNVRRNGPKDKQRDRMIADALAAGLKGEDLEKILERNDASPASALEGYDDSGSNQYVTLLFDSNPSKPSPPLVSSTVTPAYPSYHPTALPSHSPLFPSYSPEDWATLSNQDNSQLHISGVDATPYDWSAWLSSTTVPTIDDQVSSTSYLNPIQTASVHEAPASGSIYQAATPHQASGPACHLPYVSVPEAHQRYNEPGLSSLGLNVQNFRAPSTKGREFLLGNSKTSPVVPSNRTVGQPHSWASSQNLVDPQTSTSIRYAPNVPFEYVLQSGPQSAHSHVPIGNESRAYGLFPNHFQASRLPSNIMYANYSTSAVVQPWATA